MTSRGGLVMKLIMERVCRRATGVMKQASPLPFGNEEEHFCW